MSANVTGRPEVVARFRRVIGRAVVQIEDALAIETETVRTNVVADIRRLKLPPGMKLVPGPGRRNHIPSPPGGPPNSDTGRLMASYTTSMERIGDQINARVVTGVRYAQWLEFGTVRMRPRPHLIPRFRQRIPHVRARLKRIVDGVSK